MGETLTEIRVIELIDKDGLRLDHGPIHQPLRDDVERFVIFDGRLFEFDELSITRPETATYDEVSVLLCGQTTVHADICGVDVVEVVDALRAGSEETP